MFLAGLLGVLPRIFVISSDNRRLPEAHFRPATLSIKKGQHWEQKHCMDPRLHGDDVNL